MLVLVCAMTSLATASPLPRVAVVYTNNANTTYDAELDDCVLNNLKQNLSSHFEVVKNETVVKKLADTGLTDLSMAERRDIVDALSDEAFDYVICLSIEPFQRKEKFTFFTQGIEMIATVPFKVIDVKNDKYLYNGKFVEKQSDSTWIGTVGNKSVAIEALQKVNKGINKVIREKMLTAK
ncbi:hypothetical protein D081_0774 [Anaerovibrio sp. JC8]|nr:hypothetical protein D081_0774 [Anaerovibrio sp. JC8]